MASHTVQETAPKTTGPTRCLVEELYQYHRTLLRRLGWPGETVSERRIRTLGLTSCYRGEGVSTIALQLAATAACDGQHRVLLVDANLPNPALGARLELDAGPGLADVALHNTALDEAIRPSGFEGLSVLTAGTTVDDTGLVYDRPELPELIHDVAASFDLIVFDMPPVADMSSVMSLVGLLDGVALVIEAERVRREVAFRAKELLNRSNAQLLGAVLNRRRQHVPGWLYRTL